MVEMFQVDGLVVCQQDVLERAGIPLNHISEGQGGVRKRGCRSSDTGKRCLDRTVGRRIDDRNLAPVVAPKAADQR